MRATAGTVLRRTLMRPRFVGMALVTLLFAVPRLLDLGTVMTVDEPTWRARAHSFIEGLGTLNAAKTFTGGQPGVTTMWLAGFAVPFNSLAASQATIAIGSTILLLLCLPLLARLTSGALAMLGGALIALDPFLIAHSRVVHTDSLLGSFMLLTLLLLALAWKTASPRYYAYAGISSALAILTKLFGGFILLPAVLVVLFAPRKGQPLKKTILRRSVWWALPFVLALLLFWPVLLFSPKTPLAFMAGRVSMHAQSAEVGSGGGDTWYYPREFARRLTPAVSILLPLAVLGALSGTGKKLPIFPGRSVVLFLLSTALVYTALLSLSEQKSDRYILFAHLAVDLAVAAGILWLGRMLKQSRLLTERTAVGIIALLVLGSLAVEVARIHPHEAAQWNRLLPIPADVKIGWGEGLDQVAGYFRGLGRNPSEVFIASYYPGVLRHFYPANVDRFVKYTHPNVEFAVLYRSMFGREVGSFETAAIRDFLGSAPNEGDTVTIDGSTFRLAKRIVINRIPYAWVFQRLPEA